MQDLISRQAAIDAVSNMLRRKFGIGGDLAEITLADLPSVQPEVAKDTNVLNSDCISRQAAISAVNTALFPKINTAKDAEKALRELSSAQPEWNNHTVACLLAELFGDDCACNYNGIDEWLPNKCELLDACPNPGGVACWEQYLKHRAERRTDEQV